MNKHDPHPEAFCMCPACLEEMHEISMRVLILEAMIGLPIEHCVECDAWVVVLDWGHNAGFAGEGFSWMNMACGHSEASHGAYW